MADEMTNTSAETTEPTEQATQTEQQSATQTPETNYEEKYKTDKSFQSFVDKVVTKANETAVANAIQKQQRLADEKLSESERLKEMTADQRAQYFEQKYKAAELARTRDKEVESLKTQTTAMLSENKIPDVFLSVFDFGSATAEDISQRIAMLAEYEYYPKGEFDKKVAAALNEKLKTKTPETHMNDTASKDLFLQGFDG